MSVHDPITSFGIYQATIRDLVTSEMFQILILDSADPDTSQELVELRGGGSAFPWAAAPGEASGEISLTVKQFDAGVLKFFSPYETGSLTEQVSGEAAGNVGALENLIGTSIANATGGLVAASGVVIPSTGTLKFGDYIVEAKSASTLDVFVNTNIDDITYIDDALKITSAAISNPGTGGNCDLTEAGVRFTSGSGASAFTTGNKARFSVRPINTYMLQHQIGRIGAAPREFELTIVGEKIGNKIRVARYPKCIAGGGGNLRFPYKEWAQFDTTIKILQSAEEGFVGIETILNR